MAYTASSLSFILENLTKPVILTGSQIPLEELHTDALENFLGAISISSTYEIHEVMIYFAHKLLRGNRSKKTSTEDIAAFTSHNLLPLAESGTTIKINWELIITNHTKSDLKIFLNM